MNFQTHIPLEKQNSNQIDYNSKLLLLGSCFVENIGEKFSYFKFQSLQNPFGILFHPKAIETLISKAITGYQYSEADIFYHNEQWHCYDAHSRLSNTSKEALLLNLNDQLEQISNRLTEASHIIITFGTAWVYNHYKSNLPVANCHKVPQKEFIKQLLSADDIIISINKIEEFIRRINSNTQIIFTVSPVRHIKDGFVENTQSKAHLIVAIHQFLNHQSSIAVQQSFYFPSYEIMLDELRDYRFYAEDMLHPNSLAIQYIWEKFKSVWIDSATDKVMSQVDVIQKGLQHKPFNPHSEAHQKFLKDLESKQQRLQQDFPFMTF
ncbi:GSCFA domain-containing protein [Subsaxibacter sp. CAU 1640]|uniref:GSCFA domain-containing protein n=1 Tax=Subsaxibacter sp. CAU 1640 TaxID=2933271 RepID=UPI002004D549|nr:GSCFA domain-containing protein [Subsaxibacter sp. CAU 1640]MCK7591529.1 GSCFA domain-containing protein [Subsaxibacter sp. CAU 1640]